MKRVDIINGANLNILDKRNSEIYGNISLEKINKKCVDLGKSYNLEVINFQSNIEGEIINHIHQIHEVTNALIVNLGAYTHYSIAIRDALEIVSAPIIEVHLSNIFARDEFRKHSVISDIAHGVITGFGEDSYYMALSVIKNLF